MSLRSIVGAGIVLRKCIIPKSVNYLQAIQPITTLASRKFDNQTQNFYIPMVLINRQESSVSLRKSIQEKLRLRISGREFTRRALRRVSIRMYLCTAELVDHSEIIKRLNMPDTLNSWFRIAELHIWMVLCRLSKEGPDGKFCRRTLVELMWEDTESRLKQLKDVVSLQSRKRGLTQMGEQFKASILSYDEGILDNDKTLACALWRNFFEKNCEKMTDLEVLVEYVHKQMAHLDSTPREVLLKRGIIRLLPMFEDKSKLESYEKNVIEIEKNIK